MNRLFDNPVELLIRLPVLLLALTVHEFSHAYFAYRMGDPTAYRLGRCTLNPLKHLDPLGAICLLFAPIGWAKPVPINPINFHDWRKGVLVSTAAGPVSNLLQAAIWALLFRGVLHWGDRLQNEQLQTALWMMFYVGILINVGLAIFNLLPLYPLDGFHIVAQMQRPGNEARFLETAAYGPFMILGVILLGQIGGFDMLGYVMKPVIKVLLIYVSGVPQEFAGIMVNW